MDPLGRGALLMAIDNENLQMVELLVVMGIETKDALLHAIDKEFVEAVELLLEHEELIHKDGEKYVRTICLFASTCFQTTLTNKLQRSSQ
jgi:transient-receptor-potential-like protein